MQHDTLAIHGGKPAKTTPFGRGPKHSLDEWRALKPIFERGAINMTRGPEVMKLREKFCELFGRKYAVTTSSGTAALHTAMGALEIGRGDEVITSPITDMGTLTAIMQQNAVPVLADVDPLTLMITPDTVKRRITRRTRAVIPVHLAGQPCDVRGIKRVVKDKGIAIVEDMAQSYLTRQGKTYCGTVGDIGCWSLNESKHIGAGDGGMLLTNNKKLADRADLFADKCYDRTGTGRSPFLAPYNYRLSTLTAGVCLEQLKKVHKICSRRNQLGARLDGLLSEIPGIIPRPLRKTDYATYWYYLFSLDPEIITVEAADFAAALNAEGVPASSVASVLDWSLLRDTPDERHACGIHCPVYKGQVSYDLDQFPGVRRVKRLAVQTGLSESYSAKDIVQMASAIEKVARYHTR